MAETTDEAVFAIQPLRYFCESGGCCRDARWTVSLLASSVADMEVCGQHKRWAKAALVQRDMRNRGLIP